MIILHALFYAYYLIAISLTRYADVPVAAASSFVALGVCTNLMFLDKTPLAQYIPHENMPWILIGAFAVVFALAGFYFKKRFEKITARFEKTGALPHLLIMAWGIIFPCIGLIWWKVFS